MTDTLRDLSAMPALTFAQQLEALETYYGRVAETGRQAAERRKSASEWSRHEREQAKPLVAQVMEPFRQIPELGQRLGQVGLDRHEKAATPDQLAAMRQLKDGGSPALAQTILEAYPGLAGAVLPTGYSAVPALTVQQHKLDYFGKAGKLFALAEKDEAGASLLAEAVHRLRDMNWLRKKPMAYPTPSDCEKMADRADAVGWRLYDMATAYAESKPLPEFKPIPPLDVPDEVAGAKKSDYSRSRERTRDDTPCQEQKLKFFEDENPGLQRDQPDMPATRREQLGELHDWIQSHMATQAFNDMTREIRSVFAHLAQVTKPPEPQREQSIHHSWSHDRDFGPSL